MVSNSDINDKIVCVVGLGYVGIPLADIFSKHFHVIGFDVDIDKIERIRQDYKELELTSDPSKIIKADFVIIAVPTPITTSKEPDLSYVESASKIVGQNLKKGTIVVLESTVYPGVTEKIVGPILEEESGLKLGKDFKIGYSPERVNPGDKNHTIEEIIKIVSGMDKETTDMLAELYGRITSVYKTKDIKTAEAAKIIENIQRDLNIALANELSIIFNKMGLDTRAILDAASTKWNFHRYNPGLIGGHCIPVDPYYLVYKAKELDYNPQVILAGRSINNYMPRYSALLAIKGLNEVGKVIKDSKVLIMGLTYKEDVPDIRESPVKYMIDEFNKYGVDLYGYDPLISEDQIRNFGLKLDEKLDVKIDCVVVTVAHNEFKSMTLEDMEKFMNLNPVLIDIRGIFDPEEVRMRGINYKTL